MMKKRHEKDRPSHAKRGKWHEKNRPLRAILVMVLVGMVAAGCGFAESTDGIVAWGDSLTWGTGATEGGDYCSVLAGLTGMSVRKCGYPGNTSAFIAGIQGGVPLLAEPVTIPASGPVTVSLQTCTGDEEGFVFPSIAEATGINPVWIDGIEGTLDLSDPGPTFGNGFTFTRSEAGEAHALLTPAPVRTGCGAKTRDLIHIIWIGTNGGYSGNISVLINQIENMVSLIRGTEKRYLVIGITNQSAGQSARMETQMQTAFGSHYINMRKALTEAGLAENGIVPGPEDTADLAEGRVPASLRSDETHLNDRGYYSVALAVYRRGQYLGYWE